MSYSPRLDLPNFKSPPQPPPAGSETARSSSQPYSYKIASPPAAAATETKAGVQPFPTAATPSQLPLLPRSKRPALSSHRHAANPAMASKVLQDIHGALEGWHQALRQVLLDIQDLYMEGPMVEGWLEAVTAPATTQPFDPAVLRHADLQDLGGYVDRLCDRPNPAVPGSSSATAGQYHLCSLDTDGQLQCQICPPDQIMAVSQAIARHQRLRQLLNDKQYLEAKLQRAVAALTQVRTDLGISPAATP